MNAIGKFKHKKINCIPQTTRSTFRFRWAS
jgi:hypothetical protein